MPVIPPLQPAPMAQEEALEDDDDEDELMGVIWGPTVTGRRETSL